MTKNNPASVQATNIDNQFGLLLLEILYERKLINRPTYKIVTEQYQKSEKGESKNE